VQTPEAASLILQHVAVSRESGAEVFSDWANTAKSRARARSRRAGLLAQQEGERIPHGAPWVKPSVRVGELQQAAGTDLATGGREISALRDLIRIQRKHLRRR